MKKIIRLMVLFIFSIFLFSCGNSKNEIVYNISLQPRSLDPHKYSDSITQEISLNLYEGLLRIDNKGNIVPGLAQSFEKKDNTYIFTIRDGLKYSDGEDISVQDIKNGFLRVLDKKNASQYSSMLMVIKNAKKYYNQEVSEDELGIKVDGNKLIIELEKDVFYFPNLMTLPLSVPYKENKYNGAYMIVENKEQEILLEKNPYYWRKDEVKLEKVKIVYFKDYSVINNLTKNGELDLSKVDSDYKDKNLNIISNGRLYFLDFNVFKDGIINNVHLRKAISLGINRDEYVNIVKNDGSTKMLNVISDKIFNYTPSYFINKYNVEEAKKEIQLAKEELKLENIEIELLNGNTPIEIKEVQFLQEQISKLGIKVNVKTVPYKERLRLIKEGDYQIAVNTWTPKFADPVAMLDRFLFKKKETQAFDKVKYNNLVENIRIASEDRNKLINEAEKMLLENMIISPLYLSVENLYVSNRIKKYYTTPIGGLINLSYIELK